MIRTISGLSLVALLIGCASDVANRYYGQLRYNPRPAQEVTILWKKPDKPFKVIADFQSRRETPQDLQKRAANIGADAVIVTLLGGLYDTREEWASEDKNSNTYSRIIGTAIKFDN